MLTITEISGPLVTAQQTEAKSPRMLETVFVGHKKLLGEVIAIDGDSSKIQVYEDTSGLTVGEPVELRDELLSVELGPGLMGTIFDGIQRPLAAIEQASPIFITPGIQLPSLDRSRIWNFVAGLPAGTEVSGGEVLGYVMETELLKHFILVPPQLKGKVISLESGDYTLEQPIGKLETNEDEVVELKLYHKWPVKIPRPIKTKLTPKKVFQTGQRVIDAMFPIMLGAPVSTPGPFGAGKTFTQQQLAKWSNAQIVVYVGCGERGNEMTEMVKLFPTLEDPRTKRPLMERTILIANTSNMPIAAREASIYTGITIAEYFRDMGYDVVMMADSTSRWAEAMREISARLGEMPSEEGYPAYLSSKISAFYERAGVAQILNGGEGSVTAIGTVSPAGGDFSEPVTQASLKSTQVFLALDEKLAAKRHYPSINWQTSYTLYEEIFSSLITGQGNEQSQFIENRRLAKEILSREDALLEMVKLVGMDGLSNEDRLVIEIARSLREDFLQQNGFDPIDTYCSFEKMMAMLQVIIQTYRNLIKLIESNPYNDSLVSNFFNPDFRNTLSQMKYKESPADIRDILNHLQF